MTTLQDIKNFYELTPRIGTAGMPKPEQIQRIADEGYRLVINLALPGHPDAMPDEGALVTGKGMTFVHIPVDFANPTVDDFESFASVMRANKHKKVFVHCAMNFRVSAFMYLYRLIEGEASAEIARRDLAHLWQPEPQWQDLIDEVLDLHGIETP